MTYVATPKTLSTLHSNGGCMPCMADPVVMLERFKQALSSGERDIVGGRPKHTTLGVGVGWGGGYYLVT